MNIKWNNLVVLLLVIAALIMLPRLPSLLAVITDNLRGIGPHHSTDDKVIGLITFALICLTLVAVVRLLIDRGRH
jgi:hypothetical protein